MTTFDPEQGRALVKLLTRVSRWQFFTVPLIDNRRDGTGVRFGREEVKQAADTLSWALDRIAALEGAIHRALDWNENQSDTCVLHNQGCCCRDDMADELRQVLTPQPTKEDA